LFDPSASPINTIAPLDRIQISAELKQWLLTTIRHYSLLFALFVLFAIDYSPLLTIRHSLFATVRCSLFAAIRYSLFGFSRHPRKIHHDLWQNKAQWISKRSLKSAGSVGELHGVTCFSCAWLIWSCLSTKSSYNMNRHNFFSFIRGAWFSHRRVVDRRGFIKKIRFFEKGLLIELYVCGLL